ncbi:MAG TPA: toxin-antitoxin system HicB family antitoxin [Conexibacter sp.]|nr:toxin-antitoxin system HicB family antitoxin [Conexibacter sp.]
MKQLILRVSPELHQRIAARAAREGKSVNAWASELLDISVDADIGDRQARANAKAAALGMLVRIDAPRLTEEQRRRGREALRELAPEMVRILEEDRSTGL